MRQWKLDSQRPGFLATDGCITAGIVEIRLWMNPNNDYFATLTVAPTSVWGDEVVIGKTADSRNGAMRNLMEHIEKFPIFQGKIT